jgi:hypothetical protein
VAEGGSAFGISSESIVVLGRQADTAVAKGWSGHLVLSLPKGEWSMRQNDAFIKEVIEKRATVYLASPQTEANLWDAVEGRPTYMQGSGSNFMTLVIRKSATTCTPYKMNKKLEQ